MLLGILKCPAYTMAKTLFLLSSLTTGFAYAESNCTSRRCLAQMLIGKTYLSQPQDENCTQPIYVPFIEYQTLSVDTKDLRLISRLKATIRWTDPELKWDTSVYQYNEVVLPVDKIWTPEIHVTNSILTTMKHGSHDLLVYSNGTLLHNVIINAEINCEINLFNYPFAADECPVAIQTWSTGGCGSNLVLNELKTVDSTHGDWETGRVTLEKKRNDRNYIMVELKIKYSNPFITLLLPSILIILSDVVSFALPLRGGERNSFKVTLVLSFTLFLNILSNQLPGDSQCSPIIRTHFCICLVLLVLSMLVSILLTRVAEDGYLIFCCHSRGSDPKNTGCTEEKGDEEVKTDIGQPNAPEENSQMLRKVVRFLEGLDTKAMKNEQHEKFANKLDKIFFWFYFIFATAYFSAMTAVMVTYTCTVNHFDFWY
ncbi:5-hydroxytryptamine receptor 3A-like [Mugil cephalus]|uniref:5-hydroxytryptamine receptor 3A-like n=1 Tax=Mugil cephalus TaxID=48193 RepID=UPI001FB5AAC3|nr:5-hydroxytryptamine receptor 3A-like [Mugil cephalus]